MDSIHPAPLVTHPCLYAVQAAFVDIVVAAKLQAFVAHAEEEFTIHPVTHVSLQVVSDYVYSHALSAHFVVSAVENPQNAPEVFLLKTHASKDVKINVLQAPDVHLAPVV